MTLFQAFGQFAGQAAAPLIFGPGMDLLLPTSIANSGGSSSLGANGQVTYTGVSSISLNGVFSTDYEYYMLSVVGTLSTGNVALRLRSAGTDNTSNAYSLYLSVSGTSEGAALEGAADPRSLFSFGSSISAGTGVFWGPQLAEETTVRGISSSPGSGALIEERIWAHTVASAYDGFTLRGTTTGTLTGRLQVYWIRG